MFLRKEKNQKKGKEKEKYVRFLTHQKTHLFKKKKRKKVTNFFSRLWDKKKIVSAAGVQSTRKEEVILV